MACKLTCSMPKCELSGLGPRGWVCEELADSGKDYYCPRPAKYHVPHPDDPKGTVVCAKHKESL